MCAGCGTAQNAQTLSKCDRLEVWKAVLIASTFSKQAAGVVKYEIGRDDYNQIYEERLAPLLKQY